VSVDGSRPTCKIIDFGVAKAIEQRLTDSPLVTHVGTIIGTPAYMSPEQADHSVLDVDTRTDVYALGVLLYELLIGVLPFDANELKRASAEEMRRRLREEDPQRPSQRLSTIDHVQATDLASRRRTEPGPLRRHLAGDLDWIAMKAMEKDRTRRYSSPSELAADVQRSICDEPVLAGPPTVAYRMRKFVRRHRLAVTASALVAAGLVIGLTVAVWGLVRARRAEEKARQEAAAAEQTAGFLVGLFRVSDPQEAKGRTITAREILDRGAAGIRSQLAGQPLLQARMMNTMGRVYDGMGLYDEARPFLEESLETRRRLLGEDHPDTLQSIQDVEQVRGHQGQFAGSETTVRQVLERLRRQRGDDDPHTLSAMYQLGEVLYQTGNLDEAEPLLRAALAGRRRVAGVDSRDTLASMNTLASLLQDRGHPGEAEPLYREAVEGFRRLAGADDPQTLLSLNDLATLLVGQDKMSEAESMFRDILDADRRVYGADHRNTLTALNNLGVVLSMEGKLAEAEPLYRDALERRRRVLGDDHPDTMFSIHNMGGLLVDQGKLVEGERYRREAWERRKRVLGPDHPDTLEAAYNLAAVLRKLGRLEESEARYREAADGRRRVLGPEHPDTIDSLTRLGTVLQEEGRMEGAIAVQREALAAYRKSLPEGDPQIGSAMSRLGDCLAGAGQNVEAEAMLSGGIEILDRDPSKSKEARRNAIERIIRFYEGTHRAPQAAEWRARLEAAPSGATKTP
jgi:tetratricopeptide (TPR) repeat protein